MTLQRHLILFAKEPRLGLAKRRLAKEIGPASAAVFHDRMVRRGLHQFARHPGWRTWLAVTPDDFAARARRVWPEIPAGATVIGQGRGDLGMRMDRALRRPPPGAAVLVGTDIPAIGVKDIEAAFDALGRHEAVLGPAADGGYWLIGARRRPRFPYIFSRIRWSAAETLGDQIAELKRLGLSYALVARHVDIDDAQAYRAWRKAPVPPRG